MATPENTTTFQESAIGKRLAETTAAARARADHEKAEKPEQLWLPGFDVGTMPNHINRSSLFAPIARGRRKFHRQAKMVTRSDCVLEYTGEQLDEADADLLMVFIAIAQPRPLGEMVELNRAEVLKKLGRALGKSGYEWLHRRIKALTEATLFLEARRPDGSTKMSIGKTVSFRIIDKFVYDDTTEKYSFALDPRWVKMFGNREYSIIDWEKRLSIGRGQDMAKTLQRLIATSADNPQRYSLSWLKDKMEYASPLRKFREAISAACRELKRLEIIDGSRIEEKKDGSEILVLRIKNRVE